MDLPHQQAVAVVERRGPVLLQSLNTIQVNPIGADISDEKLTGLIGNDGVAPGHMPCLIRNHPITPG